MFVPPRTSSKLSRAWDSVLTHSEIILDYFQYLSIVASINVPWPDPWSMLTSWLGFLRLAFEAQLLWPGMPVLNFHAHFMIVSVLIPALFAAVFGIFFKPKRVVVWYISLLVGVGSLIAGIVIEILPFVSNYTVVNGFLAIVGGSILLLACAASFFAQYKFGGGIGNGCGCGHGNNRKKGKNKNSKRRGRGRGKGRVGIGAGLEPVSAGSGSVSVNASADIEVQDLEDEDMEIDVEAGAGADHGDGAGDGQADARDGNGNGIGGGVDTLEEVFTSIPVPDAPPWYHHVFVSSAILALVVFALLAMGILAGNDYRITGIRSLGDGVGRLFFILAGVILLYYIAILLPRGRVLWEALKAFLKANVLKLTLFLLATIYVPTTHNLVSAWVCVERKCPSGSQFPNLALTLVPQILPAYSVAPASLCLSCGDAAVCPLVSRVCPAVTDSRLAADLSLSCSDVAAFFWPCSAMMLVGLTLGVPLLFTLLIRQHTKVLRLIAPDADPDRQIPIPMQVTGGASSSQSISANASVSVSATPSLILNRSRSHDGGASGSGAGSAGLGVASDGGDRMTHSISQSHSHSQTKVGVGRFVAGGVGLGLDPDVKSGKANAKAKAKVEYREQKEAFWRHCVETSRNSARSLYFPFKHRARYFLVFRTLEKLVVVVVAVLLQTRPFALSVALLVMWGVSFLFILVQRPFESRVQHMLSAVCAGSLVIAMVFPLLLSLGFPIASYLLYLLFIVVMIFPLIGIVLGRKMARRDADALLEDGGRNVANITVIVPSRTTANAKAVSKAVDRNLNSYTIRQITHFFLVVGVLAFVSYTVLFIGTLYSDSRATVGYDWVAPRTPTDTLVQLEAELSKFEFLGYGSWTAFVQSCCCTSASTSTITSASTDGRVLLTERWSCLNGKTKIRLRSERIRLFSQVADGTLTERGLCSAAFHSGVCQPVFRPVTDMGSLLKDRNGRTLPHLGWTQAHPTACASANGTGVLPSGTSTGPVVPDRLQHESLFLW